MSKIKPFKSVDEQINNLINKNLQFNKLSIDKAKTLLCHISYYRLMAYRYPFEDTNSKFLPNTDFSDILNLYFEDQQLKSSLFNILLLIEMSIRSHLIATIGNGDLVFNATKRNIKNIPNYYWDIKDNTGNKVLELKRYSSTHVNYYLDKNSTNLVPSWIALESFTFGDLRKLMEVLTSTTQQQTLINLLSKNTTIKFDGYLDLLAKLNDLRNIIAHGENIVLKYKFTNVDYSIITTINKSQNFTDYTNLTKPKLVNATKKYKPNKGQHRRQSIINCCNNLSTAFPKLYPSHRIVNFHNETRALDTFYPYYLIIDFFITTLDLKNFHHKLNNNIDDFKANVKNCHEYLGIKQKWL